MGNARDTLRAIGTAVIGVAASARALDLVRQLASEPCAVRVLACLDSGRDQKEAMRAAVRAAFVACGCPTCRARRVLAG